MKKTTQTQKTEELVFDSKERMILITILLGFFFMGIGAGGFGAAVSFTGLGLVIWLFWRGRKL